MTPHMWTVVGLCLDLVGALLLSVEAIKLENVRRLRDQVERVIDRRFGPRIRGRRTGRQLWDHASFAGLSLFATAAMGGLTIAAYIELRKGLALWEWMLMVVCGPLMVGASLFSLFTFLVAMSETLLFMLISVLDLVDRHTPSGGIGMIGAVLIVTGFAFQIVGA